MRVINAIEFAGVAGAGKTYLAASIQPHLAAMGLNAAYVIHGPLAGVKRAAFHVKRLIYSLYLFLLMPRTVLRIIWAIILSHPLEPKRLLSIVLNVLYKLGLILSKRGTIVMDEGLVHATWSVYLFGHRFPHELCAILSEIIRRYDIHLCVINLVVDPSVLHAQFVKRSKVLGQRHDLAPHGMIDAKAFDEGMNKYPEVLDNLRPNIDQSFVLNRTSENSPQEIAALSESIIRWCKYGAHEIPR